MRTSPFLQRLTAATVALLFGVTLAVGASCACGEAAEARAASCCCGPDVSTPCHSDAGSEPAQHDCAPALAACLGNAHVLVSGTPVPSPALDAPAPAPSMLASVVPVEAFRLPALEPGPLLPPLVLRQRSTVVLRS